MRAVTILAVTAVAGLGVAACGGGESRNAGSGSGAAATATPSATQAAGSGGGGGKTVQVAADPSGALKFTTSTLKAKAGTVTFDFSNPSSVPHAFAVEGNGVDKDGKVVTAGKTSLTVKLKPGTYEFYCPVPGHRQAGMKGTLTVS